MFVIYSHCLWDKVRAHFSIHLLFFLFYKTLDLPRWKTPITRYSVRMRQKSHSILSILSKQKQRQQLSGKFAIQTLQKPLILWIIGSLMIRTLFSSDILAVFVSDKEKVIDSFDEFEQLLMNNNEYRIFMDAESTTGKNFLLVSFHSI